MKLNTNSVTEAKMMEANYKMHVKYTLWELSVEQQFSKHDAKEH